MGFAEAAIRGMKDRDIIIHEMWNNIIVDTYTNISINHRFAKCTMFPPHRLIKSNI